MDSRLAGSMKLQVLTTKTTASNWAYIGWRRFSGEPTTRRSGRFETRGPAAIVKIPAMPHDPKPRLLVVRAIPPGTASLNPTQSAQMPGDGNLWDNWSRLK